MCRPTAVSVPGPLGSFAAGFCSELAAQGYTPLSAANQVRLMAHVSRWLEAHHLGPDELTPERATQFMRARRRVGYTVFRSERALAPLLGYLRRIGMSPAVCGPVSVAALDRLLERYVDHLARERRLAATTIRFRRDVAQRFLADSAVGDEPDLKRLTAVDVRQFVLVKGRQGSIGQAKLIVVALRSLLRFLHFQGLIPTDLASAAPTIAGSRYSSLPRALEPALVRRLLDSCDRRTSSGRRDYAVLVLLSRLGLRAGEVAAMELADIDWRHGELMIRGKGQRQERLPLPADVGEALVAYMRRRPRVECRCLFLRSRAPQAGLTAGAIAHVVRTACLRAGLPEMGAHRLRHTAATQMLRRGSSLAEIAQVLRHSSILTTTIYAKVDRDALRTLAQPWPGVAP